MANFETKDKKKALKQMMRYLIKLSINISLLVVSICLTLIITIPLVTEPQIGAARKLEAAGRWRDAQLNFEKSLAEDPYNAQYPAEYGDFFIKISQIDKDRMPFLLHAEKLYMRSLNLNSHNAEYFLKLGQTQTNILLQNNRNNYTSAINKADFLNKAISNFRSAVDCDPNGFNISYSAGYTGLSLWDFLERVDKEFILNRLKYCLEIRPQYGKYIYLKLWYCTKNLDLLKQITPGHLYSKRELYDFIVDNNLWQFRKSCKALVDLYRQREEPGKLLQESRDKLSRIRKMKKKVNPSSISNVIPISSWHGTSADGKNVFNDGVMSWNGTISAAILVPKGQARISLKAKGSPADSIYPYMIVELDGEIIGEGFIASTDWRDYEFYVNTNEGIKILSVTFKNDGANLMRGEDRNIFIGRAEAEVIKR